MMIPTLRQNKTPTQQNSQTQTSKPHASLEQETREGTNGGDPQDASSGALIGHE